MAMSNDFGLVNLVVSPFLERIGREERLGGDQPRKPKIVKPKPEKKEDVDSNSSDTSQKTDDSISSMHIDLRI
jgi:hypothetical protein